MSSVGTKRRDTTVVSIHEDELARDASPEAFERSVREAEGRERFDLPGLVDYRFLRGVKGDRAGRYAAMWTYESRDAWEGLWEPPDDSVVPPEYPEPWREREAIVDPSLASDADDVRFTPYEAL